MVNDGLKRFRKRLLSKVLQLPDSQVMVNVFKVFNPILLILAKLSLKVNAMLFKQVIELVESNAKHFDPHLNHLVLILKQLVVLLGGRPSHLDVLIHHTGRVSLRNLH